MTDKKLTEQDYKQVFDETAQGRLILEDLVSRFATMGACFDEHNAELKTYYRAGQRSVVDFILSRINRSNVVTDYVQNEKPINE